jgi:hypothetical protein
MAHQSVLVFRGKGTSLLSAIKRGMERALKFPREVLFNQVVSHRPPGVRPLPHELAKLAWLRCLRRFPFFLAGCARLAHWFVNFTDEPLAPTTSDRGFGLSRSHRGRRSQSLLGGRTNVPEPMVHWLNG